MSLEPHAIGFERNRSAPGEWIKNCRQLAIAVLQHFGFSFSIDLWRVVQFLAHHSPEDVKEPFALGMLLLLGRPLVGMGFRVVDHGCEEDRPRRR